MEDKIEDNFNEILTALKFGKKWKISGKNGFLVNYRENDVIFLWDEENQQWTISVQKIVK